MTQHLAPMGNNRIGMKRSIEIIREHFGVPDLTTCLADLRLAIDTLRMLDSKRIATWYGGVNNGYYAGWDDAEYEVRKTLKQLSKYDTAGV